MPSTNCNISSFTTAKKHLFTMHTTNISPFQSLGRHKIHTVTIDAFEQAS